MHGPASDQNQLHELVSRYCRSIDRHDWDALRSVYHPDSTDDHGEFYRGPGQGFADAAAEGLLAYDRHMHSIANCLFLVDGDQAEGETYFVAVAQTPPPDAKHFQFGGRYLDIFERRNDGWKISHRHVVHDWLQVTPLAVETRAIFEGMGTLGQLGPSDSSYAMTPRLARHYSGTKK